MELGPIQKAWLASLKEHPERQYVGALGRKEEGGDNYQACCLGEGGLIAGVCEWADSGGLIIKDIYVPGSATHRGFYLSGNAYRELGLYGPKGEHRDSPDDLDKSLSGLNDAKKPWLEIANIIEANPEHYFERLV